MWGSSSTTKILSSEPYEALPKPMLVKLTLNDKTYAGMNGLAVATKNTFGYIWYLTLVNEKLLWFRDTEIEKVEQS